jgi:adenosine deaminase
MSELRAWLKSLPKAELHVHLEGTMAPETYRRIAERNGIAVRADAAQTYRCNDFASFLRAFLTTVKALQKPEDFAEVTREYLAHAAAEGIRHVELLFSPATPRALSPHLDLEAAVAAIGAEIDAAKETTGISALLIFDIVRNLGTNAALRDTKLAERFMNHHVVGIGLGGDEQNYPANAFADVYESAANAGLRRTAHAGEAAGANSIVEAVMVLRAERIGHGIAASKNPKVIKLLLDRNVAIDACPTSNKVTGAVAAGRSHPMKEFFDAGITVTLNSDDPAFFGASLLDEYENAAANLGFGRSEIVRLAENSFKASFATEEKKKMWLAELERFVAATPT